MLLVAALAAVGIAVVVVVTIKRGGRGFGHMSRTSGKPGDGGSIGGSPAFLQPYASGLNLNTFARWAFQGAFTDLMRGADAFSYLATGSVSTPIPAANLDANGWVTSVPADSINGLAYTVLDWPINACTCDMTWTGTFDSLTSSGANFSLTQTGPNTATVTFSQGLDWQVSNGVNAQIKFVPNAADPPKNISVIPQGRSGTITPEFKASIQSFTGTGPIRFIKWQPAVERTGSPLTVTARNTSSTAIWLNNDGVPFEVMLQLCVDVNRDGWFNFGLGESDSVISAKFALLDAWLAANPTRKAWVQSSNEDWNSIYFANQQLLRDWASADGLDGPVAGVAISSITFSGTTATVTTSSAHGRSTGDFITLSGASPAAYNVMHVQITVTGSTTFTYPMASTPATNATVVGSYNRLTDVFGGQIKESAKRSNHVMDLVAAAIDPTRMSRVVRVLGTWNAVTSVTNTLLAYPGTTARHDKLAVGAYWSNTSAYPDDGTTRAAPNNVAYTTADFPALLVDLKAGTDAVFDLTAQHQAKAAAVGLGLCAYEWGQQRAFSLLSIATSWYQSQQAYDALMYAAQEWERRFNVPANFFVMTDRILNESNAGRSLQEYQGETISLATTAKTVALQGYLGNTARKPNDLVAALQTSGGDPNGTTVGTITKFVRGSTITIQAISGSVPVGVLAIGDTTSATTCPITIADTSLIPTQGSYSVTLRETDPRFPAPGYHDTVLTWAVSPALLRDPFSGTSLDPQWTTGTGLLGINSYTSTGCTVTESGGALAISAPSSGSRGIGIISVNSVDLTQNTTNFVHAATSANASGLAYGAVGGTVINLTLRDSVIAFETRDGTGYSNLGQMGSYSATTHAWLRLRYDPTGSNFYLDTAPETAPNPPGPSDWTQRLGPIAKPAGLNVTTGKIGLFARDDFGTAVTGTFKGFNTAHA